MGKQIVVAIALFAVAAFLDHHRSSVDRPSDFSSASFCWRWAQASSWAR
jgi:hypothetical protein